MEERPSKQNPDTFNVQGNRYPNTSMHFNKAFVLQPETFSSGLIIRPHRAEGAAQCYNISTMVDLKKLLQRNHEAQLVQILPSSNLTRIINIWGDRNRIFSRRLQGVKMVSEEKKINF